MKLRIAFLLAISLNCLCAGTLMINVESVGAIPVGNYSLCSSGDFQGAWIWQGMECSVPRELHAAGDGGAVSDGASNGNGSVTDNSVQPFFSWNDVGAPANNLLAGFSPVLIEENPADTKSDGGKAPGSGNQQTFSDSFSTTSLLSMDDPADLSGTSDSGGTSGSGGTTGSGGTSGSSSRSDFASLDAPGNVDILDNPEPGTLSLVGVGILVALAVVRRRQLR